MISRNAMSWQWNKMCGPLPRMWLKESIMSQVQLEITCNHFWPYTRMHGFSSTQNNYASFFSAQDSKKKDIPGSAYFKKINMFMEEHVQVGKLYLEYIKGDCQSTNKTLCGFRAKFPRTAPGLERVPRLWLGTDVPQGNSRKTNCSCSKFVPW